jgi:redox-sensing transcriptional repressor
VGAGNLGSALANYGGFTQRGFPVAALFDADRAKVGKLVHGVKVHHTDDITTVATDLAIGIGVIATPAAAAQDVADKLVAAGVGSILNFAPTVISVAEGISLRKVDLALELQILSFYQEHRDLER